MRKIAHIINPVIVEKSSDLYVAQPITFETMKIAQKNAARQIEVDLFTAQYPEDRPLIPDGFRATADLERSVLDLGRFQKKRKLPLLADILDRLYEASDAEYFIFTNVDIAILPHFYITVEAFISSGWDAFVINRRTISPEFNRLAQIPLMYAEVGHKHEGHDCFIFRRDVYRKYHLGEVCLGIPWVGRVLLWNLIGHAKNFHEFKKTHLTFHLGPGNDNAWQGPELADYRAHNVREAQKVIATMGQVYGPFNGYSPFEVYPLMLATQ